MPKRKHDTPKSGERSGKKVKEQPQANSMQPTPSPQSQPDSDLTSRTEAFPNEIYNSILSHLRHDPVKTTLARCMRVSKAFKLMAAPMLYEKLEWRHMKKAPLRKLDTESVIKEGREDIITKEMEIGYIKSIEIRSHRREECQCYGVFNWEGVFPIPILRVGLYQTYREWDRSVFCLTHVRCPLLERLAPRKIVMVADGRDMGVTLGGAINNQDIEDYVVTIKLPRHTRSHVVLPVTGRPRRLIVIASPEEELLPHHQELNYHRAIQKTMQVLADQLAYHGRLPSSLCEIVLVNFDSLEEGCSDPIAHPKGTFETICHKAVTNFDSTGWYSPGDQWRTAEEAAQVTYKFITMKEYDSSYDRTGGYTTKQVTRMLEGERNHDSDSDGED